jgi:hypothetical protein
MDLGRYLKVKDKEKRQEQSRSHAIEIIPSQLSGRPHLSKRVILDGTHNLVYQAEFSSRTRIRWNGVPGL